MESNIILKNKIVPQLLTHKNLELILFPTEQCNFRCTYCYEDFSIGRMRDTVVEAIKNLIKKRTDDLSVLKISWFGGEPLSAKDIVYDIGGYAKKICEEKSIKFISGMTTNGFLLRDNTLRKMVECGVTDYQISLDGPRDIHNQTRLRINKMGSFDEIWRNLVAIQTSNIPVSITIRVHVTPDNYYSLYELIDQLKAQFGGDDRFKIFFKPISDLGGPNSKTFKTLRYAEQKKILDDLRAWVDDKLEIVTTKSTDVPYVCYASHGNSFIIRADGRIGKCTVALESPANAIGYISADGSLKIDRDKLIPWMRGINSLDENTLRCPLYGISA